MNHKNNTFPHYPEVTVIIPSYNSHKTIYWTIKGIKEQTKLDFIKEIIVVDSSDDGITPDYLKVHEDDFVKIICSGIRVMPAVQRNIGVANTNSDLLCFIDSDAYPAPDWLEIIIEEYLKGSLAGGGSYRVPEFQYDKPIAFAQFFLDFIGYAGFGQNRQKNVLPSCNMFCDRELFNKVGGFPRIRATEDAFFSLNINKHINLMFIPEAIMYHIFREDKESFLANQKLLGKYIFIYRRHNENRFYYKGVFPYLFIPGFLTIKLFRIIIRVLKVDGYKTKFFIALPLIFIGLVERGKGFIAGIREFQKIIKDKKNIHSLYLT